MRELLAALVAWTRRWKGVPAEELISGCAQAVEEPAPSQRLSAAKGLAASRARGSRQRERERPERERLPLACARARPERLPEVLVRERRAPERWEDFLFIVGSPPAAQPLPRFDPPLLPPPLDLRLPPDVPALPPPGRPPELF